MSDFCDPTDYTVHGVLQASILEWVAVPFFRSSSQPRGWTQVSCIAGGFFTTWATKNSPRILEWVAYPFSRGSSPPRNRTGVSCIAQILYQLRRYMLSDVFLQFTGCLFILLAVSFAVKKLFSLRYSHLLIFWLLLNVLWCHIQKIIAKTQVMEHFL